MKKLFTLMGALLLWQSVAVAQNYLHISSGDSTKVVRMAELDSVTVRDAEFYKLDLNYVNGLRFVGTVADYWGSSYTFDVTLAQGEGTTVYIQNLDPYFAQNGFVATNGHNILIGELVVADDEKSATITCQLGQAIGYSDCIFTNPFGGSTIDFTLTEKTLTCETGYGVRTSDGWYSAFNPFTLNIVGGTRAGAPARKETIPSRSLQLKRLELPSAITLASPRRTTLQEGKVSNMQLQPMTTREITEKE